MNPHLAQLQPYPFEKLAKLHQGVTPPSHLRPISLSIGEPKHAAPDFVREKLMAAMEGLSLYPSTKGLAALRETIANWLTWRFNLSDCPPDPETQILPVNGTREALFSFVQAAVDKERKPLVLMPNPFYQIYEGAALLAGAEPYYLPCLSDNQFIPDYDAVPREIWARCALLFVCTPGNPTGAVTPVDTLKKLIALSDEHGFVIASDECYSELYFDENSPPVGLLEACAELKRHDFKHCMVFHSLSKRSNLPGMRSGFVAGDARLIKPYLLYRTYHGCAMPVQHQLASLAAWEDEVHVRANRLAYKQKFEAVIQLLKPHTKVLWPDAGFYLWLQTPGSDEDFARGLFASQNVVVLPGQYLSREVNGENPGYGRARIALVAPLEECIEGAQRICQFLESFD